jgi:sialate O-acetylesterase
MKNKLAVIFILLIFGNMSGQVRLPKLVSDGMVLQRDAIIKIWGWAAKGEKVNVSFLNNSYTAVADENGGWQIELPKLSAGGPYEMRINAGNSITIHDILIGDVWVCSGQSNMELPMKRVSWNYPGEIENSSNNYIRQFYVQQKYNFHNPENDLSLKGIPEKQAGWKSASPENTPDFSAVAYFFAKYIYEKYKTPVGLINTSLGGSPVESWMSNEALKNFPKYLNEAEMFKDSSLISKIENADNARSNAWNTELWKTDEGNKDKTNMWFNPLIDTNNWDSMEIPGYWADKTNLGMVNGVVWFKKTVDLPSSMAGKPAMLILGRIVDADSAYINGAFVGSVGYQYPPSRFDIPAGVLKEGENSIVVRVISNSGKGGFVPDKLYAIVSGNDTVNIAGKWKYRPGAVMPALAGQTFVRWKPLGLYNSMIAPLINYKIKGVIWYQGESNTGSPAEYNKLFPAMIADWREKWNQGNFPFLFVQLPNFMEPRFEPSESGWALFREAQQKALSLLNTGMAVTYDLGEWNDIHPLNKKDVALRLFLAAEKTAYGNESVVYSGPVYKSMEVKDHKIVLTFVNTGGGLTSKGNAGLKYFSIAGAEKRFVWANARIEGNKVVVWSEEVVNPAAVRYAWADNPEGANLYNLEGLPASPFRTDDGSK